MNHADKGLTFTTTSQDPGKTATEACSREQPCQTSAIPPEPAHQPDPPDYWTSAQPADPPGVWLPAAMRELCIPTSTTKPHTRSLLAVPGGVLVVSAADCRPGWLGTLALPRRIGPPWRGSAAARLAGDPSEPRGIIGVAQGAVWVDVDGEPADAEAWHIFWAEVAVTRAVRAIGAHVRVLAGAALTPEGVALADPRRALGLWRHELVDRAAAALRYALSRVNDAYECSSAGDPWHEPAALRSLFIELERLADVGAPPEGGLSDD